jgi:hypothetical protein
MRTLQLSCDCLAMMRPSLPATQKRENKLTKLGVTLQVLDRHVDFTALAAEVDRAAPRPDRVVGGRPPFRTEVMVRILLLQQLFNLSDEQMGSQLLDRLSFQRLACLVDTSQIIPAATRSGCSRQGLSDTQERRNPRIARRAPASSTCSPAWRRWARRRRAARPGARVEAF